MNHFHVIIPAAGSGSRMATELPKQYLPLLGRPLIEHTLGVFRACTRISSVTLVLSADDKHWDALGCGLNGYGLTGCGLNVSMQVLRCGGVTRADTVLNALQAMQDQEPIQVRPDDWILVHDAARPGLTVTLLDQLLDALQDDAVGGLLAIPLADTLKRADSEQRVAATEPRDGLWQAQTPQMFRYDLLKRALIAASGTPTDEAQAIEALGFKPKLVAGELRNLKITYPQDLALAEAILAADFKNIANKNR
jgi:2-C-methyl-D-erythritol 4-phosphate cytidylyltransferase